MNIEDLVVLDRYNERYRLVKEGELTHLREKLDKYVTTKSEWDLLLELNKSEFGSVFKHARESKNITVAQIVVQSGLLEPNVRNIELGHRKPRIGTRKTLIDALRVLSEN